ncbi:hypothetical protein Q5O89_16945 [Peribacillus frigoritolerans]|nr:hypothetical protein [Peribacillus frigoritolerans]
MGYSNRNRRSTRQIGSLKRINYNRPSKPEVKEEEESKFNWYDTGLLIGMCTLVGYYMAYSFQKGKYSYYGITEIFINQVDIVTIIFSITIIGGIFFPVYSLYDNLRTILRSYQSPIGNLLLYPFLPLFIAGILLMLLTEYYIVIPIILLVIIIWIFVSPIITYKEIQGYRNKLQKKVDYNDDEGFTLTNIMFTFKHYPTARIFISCGFLIMIGPIANMVGLNDAKIEKNYFTLEHKNQEYLVIDEYGDNIIIAPFDKKKNTIKKEFQIIEVKSDFENPIVLENIYLKDKLVIPD